MNFIIQIIAELPVDQRRVSPSMHISRVCILIVWWHNWIHASHVPTTQDHTALEYASCVCDAIQLEYVPFDAVLQWGCIASVCSVQSYVIFNILWLMISSKTVAAPCIPPSASLRFVFHTTGCNQTGWSFCVVGRSMQDGTHIKKAIHSGTFENERAF